MRAVQILILVLLVLMGRGEPLHAGACERIEFGHGHALVSYPQDRNSDTPYATLIALHGTETDAHDIIAFWQSVDAALPLILLAPQSGAAGWRESDTALLADVQQYIQTVSIFDQTRLFVAGHSAGGAMAMHWTMAMGFRAGAVAATANYVPPTITPELAASRAEMPIFYAVGTADLNHRRMRAGARMLRDAGFDLTVYEPPIGHRLDQDVAQTAMRWLEQQARHIVQDRLSSALADLRRDNAPGVALRSIEGIVAQRHAHFDDQVTRAESLREIALCAVEIKWQSAIRLSEQGAPLAARQRLLDLERLYHSTSAAAATRRLRCEIENQPAVADTLFRAAADQADGPSAEPPAVLAGR